MAKKTKVVKAHVRKLSNGKKIKIKAFKRRPRSK